MKGRRWLILFVLFFVVFVSGCKITGVENVEAMTLNFFVSTGYSQDVDTIQLSHRLRQQFPHIEFIMYKIGTNPPPGISDWAHTYRELIERGIIPDLILEGSPTFIPQFIQEGLRFDHTSLIRVQQLNTDGMQPELLQHIQAWSKSDEIYAIPYRGWLFGLLYNKTALLDKGVPLPKDGMTWDDFNHYVDHHRMGFVPNWFAFESQFRLTIIDPETDEVQVDVDRWKPALAQWLRSTQSYEEKQIEVFQSLSFHTQMDEVDWDIVSYPVNEHGRGANRLSDVLAVSPLSQHQEEAFSVIQYMVSESFQLENARDGFPSILNQQNVQTQFGANLPSFQGKNSSALFAQPYAESPSRLSLYESSPLILGNQGPLFSFAISPVLRELAAQSIGIDEAIETINRNLEDAVRMSREKIEGRIENITEMK